jgi:hypothetical protein
LQKEFFIQEIRNNDLKKIKECFKKDITLKSYTREAIIVACESGHIDIVKFFLYSENFKSSQWEHSAIFASDYLNIIKLLINDNRINHSSLNSVLYKATKEGNFNTVKYLIEETNVDSSDYFNRAICYAAANKKEDILQLLFKDEKIKNSLSKDNPTLFNELLLKNKLREF